MSDPRSIDWDAAAGWWDRFAEVRDSLSFAWSDGRLQGIHQGARRGFGSRRLTKGGPVRFISTDSGTDPRDGMEGAPSVGGAAEGVGGERPADAWELDLRAATTYLEEIQASAAAELAQTPAVGVDIRSYRQWILHETAERQITDLRRGAWLEIRAAIPDSGTVLRLAGETIASIGRREPASRVGRALGARLRRAESTADAVSGLHPVVFAAGGCEALLHEIGHLFEGEALGALAAGWSPSRTLASSRVTIVDDPSRGPESRGSYRFDDEGVAPGKVVLIDRGRVADRITGRSARAPDSSANSTGHGRRSSYLDLPMPRMACTILEAGGDDPRDIVADTDRGILVTRIGTGSLDPESGRVTLSVTEGFRIEKGRVTRPIVPSLIKSTVTELLAGIDAVGSDLTFDHGATNCVKADQHLPVIVGLPTIRIGMIRVISL